ncbi:zinc-dependent alcohol dehydrogenase [Paraliomyxa miuraensis]|uniref:zinc-dependent alcohol dehydrogenase n=1 Tax=Paraliomyxa miuraensis TaxID=376150 RepID=UPI00224F4C1A|nr:zinc-binding alcohol dehydrogenase [Paraliomyxa miuraensis]MCX4241739.1 zinc-binding alcohol dehydrogenase [Paraliomyxa miuraensis]
MSTIDARAFWVTGPGRGELRTEALGEPAEDQVLVEARWSAISRGTESLVFHGRVPPSEHERMRAPFQMGDFPAPVKYGYCSVGEVVQGPDELRGRSVFCLHPHQTRYVVPADAVVPIPSEVPPGRAVLAANMETAINGLWDARLRIGDRVCVIGAGVVGCLVAYLAHRVVGCDVELVDVDPRKAPVAQRLGVPLRDPEHARGEADCVLEASGSPAGLQRALALAGREATIVVLSWLGDRPATLPLGEAFHAQRLHLVSSQVGTLPASQRARWTHRRRLELALRLLADEALDGLLTGESPFEELPQAMPEVVAPGRFVLCHRVVYG